MKDNVRWKSCAKFFRSFPQRSIRRVPRIADNALMAPQLEADEGTVKAAGTEAPQRPVLLEPLLRLWLLQDLGPVEMQLYLPQCWTDEPERCNKARIKAEIGLSTKPQIALAMAQRMHAAGVLKVPVLADSAFGESREFRHGIREMEMHYAVGIHLTTLVFSADHGKQPLSDHQLLDGLYLHRFRRYYRRNGERGELNARFAFVRVRIPKDPQQELLLLMCEWCDGMMCAKRASDATASRLHTCATSMQKLATIYESWVPLGIGVIVARYPC